MAEETTPPASSSPPPAETPAPAADAPAAPGGGLPATPLPDGTAATVLAVDKGGPSKTAPIGKANLNSVYRRADIMTTLITFGAAVLAGGLTLGGYLFFTHSQAKSTPTPKVTTLSKDDLQKLGAFFTGNSVGTGTEILNINSSSLFKNRVAVDSDLRVTGGTQITGPTALGDLTVDKTSTLSVTNIRGQLTVSGPLTVNSPAVLSNGASLTGNFTATGNGSFGGSLSAGTINAATLAVTGGLNLSGRISTSGPSPTISSGTITGTDTAGSLTTTSTNTTVTFHTAYSKTPHVLLTPNAACPGTGQFFVQETGGTGFIINNPAACTSFNYWVVQ